MHNFFFSPFVINIYNMDLGINKYLIYQKNLWTLHNLIFNLSKIDFSTFFST